MSLSLVLGVVLCGAAYLGLAWYVWGYRRAGGAAGLAGMLLAIGIWALCYALELASDSLGTAKFWAGVKFIGIVLLAPTFWGFVLRYTGRREPLPKWLIGLLLIEPVAVMLLLAIPVTHNLIHYYPSDPADIRHVGGAPVMETGSLFWPHAIYTYVLLLGAVGVLVVRLARIAPAYRRPAAVMIAASVLPFVGNVLYNLGLGEVDPTPFMFTLTCLVLVWGLFRYRLLDLLPVARDVVLDRMPDGVLVADAYHRVLDVNPAAEELLRSSKAQLIGLDLAALLPEVAPLLAQHAAGSGSPPSGSSAGSSAGSPPSGSRAELAIGHRHQEISITSVRDARVDRDIANVVVLRDITERVLAEQQLRELLDEQTRLADILQQSLRPTTLPTVAGLRLAARSVPAASGRSGHAGQVSGDFYDVHPAADGRWAFILGDVSGKGVHAAVVTSMARYTVRALSAQGMRPAEVLGHLNQVLLTGLAAHDAERFCTVVYGQVEPLGPGLGARLVLALGGHPPPLLRDAAGQVRPVGRSGTALGLLAQVDTPEVELDLVAGETLLAYTDGVTEARLDGEQFGEERLAVALAAAPACPERVADAVLSAVSGYSPDRDDVAVLVLNTQPAPAPSPATGDPAAGAPTVADPISEPSTLTGRNLTVT